MSSRGRGQVKRSGGLWWLTPCALTGLIAASVFASGCAVSRLSNPFNSGDEDASASAVNEDRLLETAKADTGTDLPSGASTALPASGGLAARPSAHRLRGRPCGRSELGRASRRDHQDGAGVPALPGSGDRQIWLCRAGADRAQRRPRHRDARRGYPRRRRPAQHARHRQDEGHHHDSRQALLPAISPWCGRSPSPSWSARGPRTTRSSSPSTATCPTRARWLETALRVSGYAREKPR